MSLLAPKSRGFCASKRSRFFKKDKEGVASVVGTIMALLVFLTFLSVLVNTWVPVAMKENERDHMNQVMNQFGNLKSSVDNMMIFSSVTGKPSMTTYQTVDLGAMGIPAFASATAGFMYIYPRGSSNAKITTAFNFTDDGDVTPFALTGGGSIQMYAPNRYYVQQWIAYENGAIIVKQDDGQVVRADPGIVVTNDGGTANLAITQMDLIGGNGSVGGTGITGLNLNVIYVDTQTYSLEAGNTVVISMLTNFGPAFYDYLNQTMTDLQFWEDGSGVFTKSGDDYSYMNGALATAVTTNNIWWKVTLDNQGSGLYKITFEIQNPDRTAESSGTLSFSQSYVNVELSE